MIVETSIVLKFLKVGSVKMMLGLAQDLFFVVQMVFFTCQDEDICWGCGGFVPPHTGSAQVFFNPVTRAACPLDALPAVGVSATAYKVGSELAANDCQ